MVVAVGKAFCDRLVGQRRGVERVERNFRSAHRLHQRLLKALTDCHNLARRLHLRAESARRSRKFIERPFGEFYHKIVDCRLKAGTGNAGNIVFDFVERVAERNLGGDFGNGIARRLGRECRGARNARIYLDDGIFRRFGIERKLTVTAADDIQRRDDIKRGAAEHLILLICQRKGGRNNDAVAGMHTDGVDVLHTAHGNNVSLTVAHCFKFYFLPAIDISLDQNLSNGRSVKTYTGDRAKLLCIVGDAAAPSAERKGGTDDDGVTDAVCNRYCAVDRFGGVGWHGRLTDFVHSVLEKLSVLRLVDCLDVGSYQTHTVRVQKALLVKLHRECQTRLTSETRKQTVGAFLFDYSLERLRRQRFKIYFVCKRFVGHNGGGIGVNQHHLDALAPQNGARLRAGIVKLGGLTDYDRSRADYHYLFYCLIYRHCGNPPLIRQSGRTQTPCRKHRAPAD